MARDPETIGRYRVLQALGAGGMGVVYLAEDPLLKRRVAVKLVHGGGLEQGQAMARFRREAEVSARLNHPNVITVYDVGEEPGLGPFLTMEYVDGATLSQLVRENALDPEARLRILIHAMAGLLAAHAAGIIHRDIKPANLMVARDGRVKLMDFGIARTEETSLTSTGSVLGTPTYIAPEQLLGADPTPATDRYAFAVMAFELLTGQQPYSAPSATALLYKIAHEPPNVPETLAPSLKQVFLRALDKDPAKRLPDLPTLLRALIAASPVESAVRARLLARLEEVSPATPVADSAEPEPAPEPTPPPVRVTEGSAWRAVWLVVPIVVAALAAVVLWPRRSPDPIPSPAEPVAAAARQLTAAPEPAAPLLPRVESAASAPKVEVAPRPPDTDTLAAMGLMRLRRLGLTEVGLSVRGDGTAVVSGSARSEDVAKIDTELVRVDGIEHVDRSELVVRLSAKEVASRVRAELSDQGMPHVEVDVDSGGRLVLANLADSAEAERAKKIASRIGGDAFPIETSLRRTAAVTSEQRTRRAEPVDREPRRREETRRRPTEPEWGVIERDGAERTE